LAGWTTFSSESRSSQYSDSPSFFRQSPILAINSA
jgi:hypothetical protein